MSMQVKYIQPNENLLQYVADNMRAADALECELLSGLSPMEALTKGVEMSHHCSVVVIDGKPCGVVGLVVINILGGTGVPWLLATDDAVKYKRIFINNCKQGVEDMRTVCPNLMNFVHADNKLSIKWLKWMGFTIEPSEPIGKDGAHFHKFHIGDCHV